MDINLARFSDVASPKMSDAYVHINTKDFIASMAEEGFDAVDVKFDRAVKRDPRFIRHMVSFEHRDSASLPRQDVRPRVLFINSHNGTVRASVVAGAIRFACMNGLVVGAMLQRISAKHLGDSARDLIQRARDLARSSSSLFAGIEEWERIELTREQELRFAERAAVLRWGESSATAYPTSHLLAARRFEDEGRSLWRVFNRIQENATRGGFDGRSANGRRVLARALSGITADTTFNAGLWRLAEEVAEAS